MPGRFELTSTLAKIWHAPDHFRLLDPLPPMHRRGIIAGFLLVIIGILLPSDDSQNPASTSREANLNLQSQSQPQAGGNQAVPLPPITNTPTVSDADRPGADSGRAARSGADAAACFPTVSILAAAVRTGH